MSKVSTEYQKAVNDCKRIMSELYDEHGDYSEVETVYFKFCERAGELLRQKRKEEKQ